MINDFSSQADAMGKYFHDFPPAFSSKNQFTSSLAEQVKQRKLRAIGTRTQLQAIERQNMSKKVFCDLRHAIL